MVIPGPADEPRISIREGFIDPEALVSLKARELSDVDLGVSLVLDVGLQKAACARAVLERQLGRRLRRLRDTDQLKHFGCSRFGDFVAERLPGSLDRLLELAHGEQARAGHLLRLVLRTGRRFALARAVARADPDRSVDGGGAPIVPLRRQGIPLLIAMIAGPPP